MIEMNKGGRNSEETLDKQRELGQRWVKPESRSRNRGSVQRKRSKERMTTEEGEADMFSPR